jgi:predicted adenylyl cyclase CyaB
MLRRNLELKARCNDLARARAVVRELVGVDPAVENQCDTYFNAPLRRLKLREIDGQPAVLIAYARPNDTAARLSRYRLVPVSNPAALKAALGDALGIYAEVRKRREISLWHNVRIHLDEVASLGTFIEFEAVLGENDDEALAHRRLEELRVRLQIEPADLLAPSYVDLLSGERK